MMLFFSVPLRWGTSPCRIFRFSTVPARPAARVTAFCGLFPASFSILTVRSMSRMSKLSASLIARPPRP